MTHIYLVYGSTKPLVDKRISEIIENQIQQKDEFNYSQYELKEVSFSQIAEDAMTFPFLSECKVIHVKDSYIFTGEKVKPTIDINIEEVLSFLEQFKGPNIVIFEVNQDKLDERKKIVKTIKKKHQVIQIEPLNEEGTKALIKKTLNDGYKDIKADALNTLIELTGVQYDIITKELDKVLLFVGDEPVITKAHIEAVVSRSLEQNVFLLTEFIIKGQKQKAIYLLKDLIQMKEEPIKLLALITGQYRLFYQAKILKEKGFSEAQIAKQLKVHPYRVKLALRNMNKLSLNHLLTIMDSCAETDYQLKSSYMDKDLILELFILKI